MEDIDNDSLIITKKEKDVEYVERKPKQDIEEIKRNIKINFKYFMKREITEEELNEYLIKFHKGTNLFEFMEEKGYKPDISVEKLQEDT
jgi:hypothetical protein